MTEVILHVDHDQGRPRKVELDRIARGVELNRARLRGMPHQAGATLCGSPGG
jgi:hypothetical protein